jgi:hypothetical protein
MVIEQRGAHGNSSSIHQTGLSRTSSYRDLALVGSGANEMTGTLDSTRYQCAYRAPRTAKLSPYTSSELIGPVDMFSGVVCRRAFNRLNQYVELRSCVFRFRLSDNHSTRTLPRFLRLTSITYHIQTL